MQYLIRETLVEMVLDVHVEGAKIKNIYRSKCYNDVSSIKQRFMEEYLCWYTYGEEFVPHKIMVEKMSDSISSSNNVHEVFDVNDDSYRNMVMDVMRMNWSGAGEFPIVDEEPNADAIEFLDLLKSCDETIM